MTKDEVLKQALEALDIAQGLLADVKSYHQPKMLAAYTAVKQALAAQPAPVQEPEIDLRKQWPMNGWKENKPAAQPAVPEGWKLVPIKPTKEMAIAYWQFNDRQDVRMIDAWKAILEAAPEKGQP